ncbi:MAG: hypothetical protein QXF82_04370 [Nitrososphaeria archaeon]
MWGCWLPRPPFGRPAEASMLSPFSPFKAGEGLCELVCLGGLVEYAFKWAEKAFARFSFGGGAELE